MESESTNENSGLSTLDIAAMAVFWAGAVGVIWVCNLHLLSIACGIGSAYYLCERILKKKL